MTQANDKKTDKPQKEQAQTQKEQIGSQHQDKKESSDFKLPEPNFANFISSLASQVLVNLGELPHPITNKKEVNIEQAKYLIDVINMLQEKTKGNLTEDEQRLIDGLLYDLRMRFVGVASKKM